MAKLLFALLVVVFSVAPCQAAGIHLSIHDGLVSIDAEDVTIRQILDEWARVGKTRIVNAERLSGGPISIKFDEVPEKQALDIILRTIPGYMAAPREAVVANASVYGTILVMPTTAAVPALRSPGPSFGGTPGAPGTVTQRRQAPAYAPGVIPVAPDPATDPQDDPAIAAAAAAGLLTVPAPTPGSPSFPAPLVMPPNGVSQPGPASSTPVVPVPPNPWNVPVGAAQPGLAPPPPATQPGLAPPPVGSPQLGMPQPPMRGRPPQADR